MQPLCGRRSLPAGLRPRLRRQAGASWIEYLLIAGIVSAGAALALTSGASAIEEGYCMLGHRLRSMLGNTSFVAACRTVDGRPAQPADANPRPGGEPRQ